MAYVTAKDYKKLAEAVADDLIETGVSLNESIAKLASSMDLTDPQTQRLCEAANNETFNKLFKKRESDKTASDRLIEFDVADYKKVLGNQIKAAEAVIATEKTASMHELRELEDEMSSKRTGVVEEFTTKVAFELRPEVQERPEITARTVRKTLEHLGHEKIAAEMQYHDTLQSLRGRFRRAYDVLPFDQFEKQAAVAFGRQAEMHLNAVRELMGLPEVTYNVDTLAKHAGYVDDTTPEMQLLASLIKTAERASAIVKGMKKLEAAL